MAEKTQLTEAKQVELNHSERFTNKVLQEFGSNSTGAIQVSDYQKVLIQGYFIAIDGALKVAEKKRIEKNTNNKDHKYDENLEYKWDNVNLNDLALSTVHFARMGLDMMQDNHLSPIPFKNKITGKYDITLMPGYNGIIYIAEKYALNPPKNVVIELVYSTDKFLPIKKGKNSEFDTYEFEITNPFARGEIIGGFGYLEYDNYKDNKLIIMTKADIEKRKPEKASAYFWGGEVKEWEGGKQVTVQKEGWVDEMYLKTLKRAIYSPKNIPLDPKKVDDNYQFMKQQELELAKLEAQAEINENANNVVIEGEYTEVEGNGEIHNTTTEEEQTTPGADF